jgi:hypothetical protein
VDFGNPARKKVAGQRWIMWWTILISMTGMVLVSLFSLRVMSSSTKSFKEMAALILQGQAHLLNQVLTGGQGSYPGPTPTTSTVSDPAKSLSPAEQFDLLSPEMQSQLEREYLEYLESQRTLSGKPPRTNGKVEQKNPGADPTEQPSLIG